MPVIREAAFADVAQAWLATTGLQAPSVTAAAGFEGIGAPWPAAQLVAPGPQRKKLTVPVGVGAFPPGAVPETSALSVIGSAEPSWRVVADGLVVTEMPQVFRSPRTKSLSVALRLSEERVSAMNEPKQPGAVRPSAAKASVRLMPPSTNSAGSSVLAGLGPDFGLSSVPHGMRTLFVTLT